MHYSCPCAVYGYNRFHWEVILSEMFIPENVNIFMNINRFIIRISGSSDKGFQNPGSDPSQVFEKSLMEEI